MAGYDKNLPIVKTNPDPTEAVKGSNARDQEPELIKSLVNSIRMIGPWRSPVMSWHLN
jgi:hypothetical protein